MSDLPAPTVIPASPPNQHEPELQPPPHPDSPSNATNEPSLEGAVQKLVIDEPTRSVDEERPEEQEEEEEEPKEQMSPEETRIEQLERELEVTKAARDKHKRDFDDIITKVQKMKHIFQSDLEVERAALARSQEEVEELRESHESLSYDVETLQSELRISNEEAVSAHSEANRLRKELESFKNTTEETSSRENELRDALEDLERAKIDREEWEAEAMRERVKAEELAMRLAQVEMELATVKSERETLRDERDREAESAANLHAVLEEFQVAKERELKATLGDLQGQLQTANQTLADYRQRATAAETRLSAALNDSERVFALTKEIREKNLVIGKLRHEAVILNEHLTEALRRLKKDAIENSVDRRLVSNVLITFLTTPRGDPKRFEILQLLSSILSWSDDQREQVGLQRSMGMVPAGMSPSAPRTGKSHARSSKTSETDPTVGDTESFSNLWIEFLLKEVSQAEEPTPMSPGGTASSQRFNLPDLPPLSPGFSTPTSRRPSSASLTSSFRSTSNGTMGE